MPIDHRAKGLKQVSDSGAIEALVIRSSRQCREGLRNTAAGRQLFGFFVGLAMKASKARPNPAQLNDILKTETGRLAELQRDRGSGLKFYQSFFPA